MHPAHRIGCVPKYLDGKNFWCALDPRAPIAQVRVIPITWRPNPKSRVVVIWIVTNKVRECTVFGCAEGRVSISPSGFKSDWSKLIRIGRVNDVTRQRFGFSETPFSVCCADGNESATPCVLCSFYFTHSDCFLHHRRLGISGTGTGDQGGEGDCTRQTEAKDRLEHRES